VKTRVGSQHQDIIEINGKKYDAISGKMLTVEDATIAAPAMPQLKKTGVVVDGFVRPKHKVPTGLRQSTHKQKTPQKSHTLMRSVVKKPTPVTTKTAMAQSKLEITKPSLAPSKHLVRAANTTHKSPMITRYGDVMQRSSVIKKTQHLPVKAPVEHVEVPATQKINNQSAHVAVPQQQPAPHHARSKASSLLIEKALASATSHEQPAHKVHKTKKRHKLATKFGVSSRAMAVSTSVLAGVMLGGFFAVQNVPNLSMRVAAARAGFAASMPSYKPSGFSFKGPINYSSGVVTVSFKSNTDDRSYAVTQRSSNWNSDALLSNYVVAENKQYQTYIDRGRTLYIYDGSNATWVDNGIWYQVEGQSDMTTDQLVRIAASI
jgi:Domain of unknown function (DUF4367)